MRELLRQNGFVVVADAIDPVLLDATKLKAWDTIAAFADKLKEIEKAGDLPYCLPMAVKHHHALLDHAEALHTGCKTSCSS